MPDVLRIPLARHQAPLVKLETGTLERPPRRPPVITGIIRLLLSHMVWMETPYAFMRIEIYMVLAVTTNPI